DLLDVPEDTTGDALDVRRGGGGDTTTHGGQRHLPDLLDTHRRQDIGDIGQILEVQGTAVQVGGLPLQTDEDEDEPAGDHPPAELDEFVQGLLVRPVDIIDDDHR